MIPNPHAFLFARFYDSYLAKAEQAGLGDRRAELLSHARGRVLEIGTGTGLNLSHYPAGLEELVLLEPDPSMRRILGDKVAKLASSARVVSASAEALPFEAGAFDTVVCTLTLCTVNSPARVLAEVRRVLVPGGKLLFLEHVRSSDARLARWQDRLKLLWQFWAFGCHCNRETEAAIESAPFAIEAIVRGTIPAIARIVEPMIMGRAVAK